MVLTQRFGVEWDQTNTTGCKAHLCSCNELIKKVYFLKTHKTASSTFQNILFRYGERYNLKIGMPTNKSRSIFDGVGKFSNMLGFPESFKKEFLNTFHGLINEPDIICLHHVLEKNEISRVFPNNLKENLIKLTIVRDPLHQTISGLYYFGWVGNSRQIPKNVILLRALEEQKKKYYSKIMKEIKQHSQPLKRSELFRNSQLNDMGIFRPEELTLDQLQKEVDSMVKYFDLILIADYFDESLVLLKEILCVDYEELAYTKKLSQHSHRMVCNDGCAEVVQKWNKEDVYAYRIFNETFWRKIEQFGIERMQEELIKLRKARNKFNDSKKLHIQ
ncbi:hypothetical protein SNEBB_000970 [Seison nebaliae]|nr:hypothetical protein SNEBB_000970 [Seison nebaliae]